MPHATTRHKEKVLLIHNSLSLMQFNYLEKQNRSSTKKGLKAICSKSLKVSGRDERI